MQNNSSNIDLKNRIVLITGASRGIGSSLALEFSKCGAKVIAVGRNEFSLQRIKNLIFSKTGKNIYLVRCDLNNAQDINKIEKKILTFSDKIDVFIANAAILGPLSSIKNIHIEELEKAIRVNFISQWQLMSRLESLLKCSDSGRVIILSSSAAHKIRPCWSVYSSSKAALEIMARCWSEELKSTNIKVNCVNPGATNTQMRASAFPKEDSKILPNSQEIAKKILFLASPKLRENGQLFDVQKNCFLKYHIPS